MEHLIWPTGCVSRDFRAENETPRALTAIYTGQKVWLYMSLFLDYLSPQNKMYTIVVFIPNLVYKLLHTCLQAPDFKLDCD